MPVGPTVYGGVQLGEALAFGFGTRGRKVAGAALAVSVATGGSTGTTGETAAGSGTEATRTGGGATTAGAGFVRSANAAPRRKVNTIAA